MESETRPSDLERPAQPGPVNTAHATSTADRAATIRDALLWGAAFVPFIALALLPRRSQLNKLRGEISSLSRQSIKQSKSILEALALLRQGQEDTLVEFRQRLGSNAETLAKLQSSSSTLCDVQERQLQEIMDAINAVVESEQKRDSENTAVNREAIAALEEARNHLTSSRRTSEMLTQRLSTSLADIAAFMEKVELEHGPGSDTTKVIERLRSLAFGMGDASPSKGSQVGKEGNHLEW